ncbi:MAG: SGNH/GDSL hydrolase family protein [Saccharofermentanales bacterium]
MKTIVCTGDSHTWGQGAAGMTDDFSPPAMAGDLRWGNFESKCYVNLLREDLNQRTNSTALQFGVKDKKSLHLTGDVNLNENITLLDGQLSLATDAVMARIQFRCGPETGDAEVDINSVPAATVSTYSKNGVNQYKTVLLQLDGTENTVTIRTVNSAVDVYKIELYSGEAAVINSGVGSCTTRRFLDEYWESHVMQYSPEVVLIEGHSINDWLNNVEISEYIGNLKMLFTRTIEIGAVPILLTVSPILGNQLSDSGVEYKEYIEASKTAAVQSDVKIADANLLIESAYEHLSHETRHLEMFMDVWHVNDLGHKLYYEASKDALSLLTRIWPNAYTRCQVLL